MNDTLIPGLALEAHGYFETKTRPREGSEGERYVTVSDRAPEWVTELVRAVHGDGEHLPDDWLYEATRAACEHLSGVDEDAPADELTDQAHEFADAHVDVYTSELLDWAGSAGWRLGYSRMAIAEGLAGPDECGACPDVEKLLSLGQYLEAREVFETVARFLGERAEAEGVSA